MKKGRQKNRAQVERADHLVQSLFWLCLLMLVGVPLLFSTAVYKAYVIPRYALLITGTSLIVLLLALIARRDGPGIMRKRGLRSWHIALVCLYFIAVTLSTLFGTAPVASFFGSTYNQMGLLTRLCFFVFFIALIVALGANHSRFRYTLWAMALTGLIVATYAYAQFFGRDPFITPSRYTFASDAGSVVRVHSTLGHSNFLGNFLLYTTLLTAGLGLASSGRARRIAVAATVISTAAIIFSGTRGAWIGLIAGTVIFITIWFLDRASKGIQPLNRKMALWSLVAIILIALLGWAISANPVSRSISLRARSLAAEGFTGSGRTLLWSDALKMLPDFALTGCGPEAFRREFPAYRSRELARLAPRTNNESAHNSYLDAAISHGFAGAALYVAMITSMFGLIWRARRRAASAEMKNILTGLAAAMIAVTVHNFFIFDQITTGLYFFAFVALAMVACRMVQSGEGKRIADVADKASKEDAASLSQAALPALNKWRRIGNVFVITACAIVLLALWYSVSLVRADRSIGRAFAAAGVGDLERVIERGSHSTQALDPTGAYDFLFAQALTLCAERIQSSLDSKESVSERAGRSQARTRAIEMAITFADRSAKHTITPDSNHLLLAYLGLLSGNSRLLRDHAVETVRLDPNLSNARWLMAEAFLAEGDREQAKREANLALALNPYSGEARLALRRARGRAAGRKPGMEESVSYARAEIEAGNIRKAERILRRAIRKSNEQCSECHLLLSSIYEAENRYEPAVAEMEIYLKQSPASAPSTEITRRIERLRSKVNQGQ